MRRLCKMAITAVALCAIQIIGGKDGNIMMAMLFAIRVTLGKTTFNDVPAKLKASVAEMLIDEIGMPELVPVEFGGTLSAEA